MQRQGRELSTTTDYLAGVMGDLAVSWRGYLLPGCHAGLPAGLALLRCRGCCTCKLASLACWATVWR